MPTRLFAALALAVAAVFACRSADDGIPRVLFVTHSAGHLHDVVKRAAPDAPSHAERQLSTAAAGRFDVTVTQDCAELAATALAGYDAVVFYTTGELPVPPPGPGALFDFVRGGGAFVGIHCATDTFYEVPEYQAMLGGVFDGHPWNQQVTLRVEDGDHPATRHLGETWRLADEIYQFRDFDREAVTVLLSLDNDSVDASLGAREDGDYALAWCRPFGEGRVFYTALGHGEDVWRDDDFLEHVLGGIDWALGAD